MRCFGIPGFKRNMNKSIVYGQQIHPMAWSQGGSPAYPKNPQHTKSSSSSPLCQLSLLRQGQREIRSIWKLPQPKTEEMWRAHGCPGTSKWALKVHNLTLCTPASQVCCGSEDMPRFLSSHIWAVPRWLLQQGSLRHFWGHICPRENPKISSACMERGNCSSLGCHSSQGLWRRKGVKEGLEPHQKSRWRTRAAWCSQARKQFCCSSHLWAKKVSPTFWQDEGILLKSRLLARYPNPS